MTAILAINRDGQTWLASDSATFWGSLNQDIGPKYFVTKGIGIAYGGNVRSSNIIKQRIGSYKWPRRGLTEKSVREFSEWIRKIMGEAGGQKEASGDKDFPSHGYIFLVTDGRRIYSVSSDASICRHRRFFAAGAGQEYCIGVMEALYGVRGFDTESIARRAIKAAIKYSAWVGGRAHAIRIRPCT